MIGDGQEGKELCTLEQEVPRDLLMKIQEYDDWEKTIKDYSATKYPELNIDFYISQIDVALGLGDIAAAENLTTRLTRDRKLRQVSKKIDMDINYKNIYGVGNL